MQTHKLFAALMIAGCSTSPTDKPLPSASNTPHLESLVTNVACGQDVAFYGATTPDLRYAFTYDNGARLVRADGVWLASGDTETIDYTYSGDNLVHILGTGSWDGSQAEVTAHYDAANNLVDYTYAYDSPDWQDAWTYAYSNFLGPNQPAREVISEAGTVVMGYDLAYDALGRLVEATPDTGAATTWSYDDVARTITMDTGNGAVVGVFTYDDDNRELASAISGTDPELLWSDETYAWAGDDLQSVTYRSGSSSAPQQLEIVEVATMRYSCAAARQLAGRRSRFAGTRFGR